MHSTVTIESDIIARLYNKRGKLTAYSYRIIKGIIDSSGEPIFLVTNILDEKAYEIAKWYKERWKIEVFFKFIKQNLNVKHLVSRSQNGIKVMIYCSMIVAILILAYKKINNIKGYKIAKLKFELELDTEIMKHIVELCGGDPSLDPHYFNSA